MSYEYIELYRSFHELSLNGGDGDEFDFRNLRYGKSLGWPALLAEYRAVILSEAGSGKTEEIRHAAKTLRAEGKPAFFLRLEHVPDDFEIAFEEGTLAEFEQWIASDEEGWVFLDSVDEARLREPQDFERAIRKMGVRLSAALQRVHIVLTSRGTAWRPVTDLAICQRRLRFVAPRTADQGEDQKPQDGAKDNFFKIVALDDLSTHQAAKFASAKGIRDTKPFVDAIERADAWSMVARPDDLAELISFWRANGKIGNRLELMQSSVARRLAERDQNRDIALPLSAADAISGARTIAAAATMAHESTIRVPDGSENANGLPVASVLPGWDANKCAALLTRPIFDEAIYGTVRFHHRTVREYLTAEWFKELLDRETSRRKIEGLFFREQYGLNVIVPTMRPVLVWLILLDEKIRDRALAISPELIFEGGEPKALPLEIRRQILRDVCETMHSGVVRGTTTDYRAVQRFADQDIAADVKTLLAKYASDAHVTSFLLRMVWQGELSDVLPEAKQIATNRRAQQYTRISAIRAVRAAGSEADRAEVRERFLSESASLSRDWLAELIEDLPPELAGCEWLLACIAKLKPRDEHKIDSLPQSLDAYIQTLDLDVLAKLLDGLAALIAKRPVVERRYCEISQRYGWLLKNAAQAAERLIAARHSASLGTSVLSTLHKLPTAGAYREWDLREISPNLPILVREWPELKDALFWYEAGEARRYRLKKRKERVTAYWQVSMFGSFWKFEAGDFDRVIAEVKRRTVPDDRQLALSLAFNLYVNAGRPRKWRDTMKRQANTPALRNALQGLFHPPPPTDDQKRWRRSEAEYKRRRRQREKAEAENEQKWKAALARHIDKVRGKGLAKPTDIFNHQYWLYEKMREMDPQSSHWTVGNWEALEPEFGSDIANAFREGVVAYWRNYSPKLRSEGKVGNSTPLSVIFGLTGLNIEARETEGWPSGLSEADAERAFRYAMDELNGFPDWLPSLFEAFPTVIRPLLLREVDYDLKIESSARESHYALYDLSWNGEWAWPYIRDDILARVRQREPKNLSNLRYMLNILHGAGIADRELTELAELRSADRRHDHAAYWFAVWTGVEPDKAIPAIGARINTVRHASKRTHFAMQFITQLLGGRRSEAKVREAFRTPHHLRDLYALMHRHIRQRDDIRRAGMGVYSPELRDDAQDARNQLFALLKEIPGKLSFLALMDLANFHPDTSSRPWMLHHAKTKAELDADLTPWLVSQTLEFQGVIERTPANHRELFELAELRFLDLKDGLEHGDSSVADILIKGATQETEMRTFIGDWFREKAQGRYVIPQEEELADAKRMDMRLHGIGFDAPVPVELKLADKWSGPKLFERLENQLCGDYLRDNRSNLGVFILVYRGEKANWELPAGGTVGFVGLVETLQAHWFAISDKFPKADNVRVIGIDLTRRSQNRPKGKPAAPS